MHVKRTLIATLALAAALPAAGARADGLPLIGVEAGPTGVTTTGSDVRYVALAARRDTLVARVQRAGGVVERWRLLRGSFTVPSVAYDGSASGLSGNGRTLVLIRPRRTFPQRRTVLAVLSSRLLVRRTFSLRGDFSFDALSPDGRTLYLIQYVSPRDPTRYAVRAYDLRARRLLPAPIVDPREPDERMAGLPVARVASADGRWAYTLYAGRHPFVHALDTGARTAACIDLEAVPEGTDVFGLRLRLGRGGRELAVVGEGGPRALIDTTTLRVREPRAAAPRPEPANGAPSPLRWIGIALAAAVAAATVGAWRHRRSTSPA